jgi:transposase InsO family protein
VNRFQFVADHQRQHGVKRLCQVIGIARSSFYHWKAAAPDRAVRAAEDGRLASRIRTIHRDSAGTYGVPRVTAELREAGHPVNHKRVARVMRGIGLAGLRLRRRHRTTVADQAVSKAPDLIGRDFTAQTLNTRYVGDITYLPIAGGTFHYLATVMDLCSRRLVGWAIADHMRTELVLDALHAAQRTRGSLAGAVFHSDHGAQYSSRAFGDACREAGVTRSMGAVGSSADNAAAESFNATLKRETLQGRRAFTDERDARLTVFRWLHRYNTRPAATPACATSHRSPMRRRHDQHQLWWRKPHNPCPRSGVKPRRSYSRWSWTNRAGCSCCGGTGLLPTSGVGSFPAGSWRLARTRLCARSGR